MGQTVLICLTLVFFVTAVISVVTGGTSLITVPVMLQLGIDPHVAVATNMFALIFLSLGGTVPFRKDQVLYHKRLPILIGLTLVGSILGAFLLLVVPSRTMPAVIATAMLSIAIFSAVRSDAGLTKASDSPSRILETAGFVATFLLGVYGGFFSGGYVTLLTAAYVGFFRMTFLEAVSVTKVLNVFSSLVATAVFAREGIVEWKLGVLLSLVSFVGAILGGMVARRMSNVWLRRIFVVTIVALAVKMLLFDVRWTGFRFPAIAPAYGSCGGAILGSSPVSASRKAVMSNICVNGTPWSD